MKKGHRVDSNHRRTGTIPIPSDLLKVDALIYFVGMVRYHQFESHAYRRILLSASSRASNVPLHTLKIHRGRLSATSPAHHRMAINHLLHRLDMMCFLALGATSYLTKCENLRSDTIPDLSSDCAVCEYDEYSRSPLSLLSALYIERGRLN